MSVLPNPVASLRRLSAEQWRRAALAAYLMALIGLLAQRLWGAYALNGLFRDLAVDFGLYYAQAMVLRSGDSGAIYDLGALARQLQVLTPYTSQPASPLSASPLPYLPVFVWLFIP